MKLRIADVARLVQKVPVEICLFWLFLAVGVFARCFMFTGVPADINQDEAFAGYNAYTLLTTARDSFGFRMPVYLTAWGSGMNALESYLMVPFVALFGLKVWVIRLPMLLAGIFSLVAIYKLVKMYVGARQALAALFVLAIAPWHIMLSRWGLESNLAPAFVLFGIYFFAKGVERPKFLVLSALFYGLSLYAYATIWAVIPFMILLQVAYLFWIRKLRNCRYTWIALAVLLVLGVPLLLFMLVNQGRMDAISLPFLSIPKLLYFRDSEISFEKIPENIGNLFSILTLQSDGLPWNFTEKFGIFYPISIPFFFVGLLWSIEGAWKGLRARIATLDFFVLVWLAAGFAIGILINVNINRVNLLFIPMLVMIARGLYVVFNYLNPKALVIPFAVYACMFVSFENHYFTDYRNSIAWNFCRGIEDAMTFVETELKDAPVVNVERGVSWPRVLFFAKPELSDFLQTVGYTNYPAAFLDASRFGRYHFYFDKNRMDGTSVYLLNNDSGSRYALENAGYEIREFEHYLVGYPKK